MRLILAIFIAAGPSVWANPDETGKALRNIFDASHENAHASLIADLGPSAKTGLAADSAPTGNIKVIQATQPALNSGPQQAKTRISPVWRALGNTLNAFWNFLKLLVLGPVSIASNLIEGTLSGISALFHGHLIDGLTWPLKVAINAAWNSAAWGLNLANVASDAIWQFAKPADPRADVYLVGSGPRMRTVVIGGPLSHVNQLFTNDAPYYVFSSAFVQSRDASLGNDPAMLAHEFGHTFQAQDSFMVDLAIRRGWTSPKGVEDEADTIGARIKPTIWTWH